MKKDVHHRILEITARALSAKTKNYAKNKAPHVDRLLDPRPGLSLISAANGQNQARLELVDQLNAEEVGVELVETTDLVSTRLLICVQVALTSTMEPSR